MDRSGEITAEMDPSAVSTHVPCTSGRLDFSWGLGTQIMLLEVQDPHTGQGGVDPAHATVLW